MNKRNITIGILAHVDAGKTTLSESLLYSAGAIRTRGRVDHGDAFLDTDEMEKKRGITIFSKMARFQLEDQPFILLDTPGHVDFSPEMERTLRVLDAAILVISAPEMVTAQVRVLWKLFSHYNVPCMLYVNKMDQLLEADVLGTDGARSKEEEILRELSAELGSGLVRFDDAQLTEENEEPISVLTDDLTERILEGGHVTEEDVQTLIRERKLFPVYFGAALRDLGTTALMEGMRRFLSAGDYAEQFGGIVYKITREDKTRLTWLKITGGSIHVRDEIREEISADTGSSALTADPEAEAAGVESTAAEETTAAEKISAIRRYSGEKFELVTEAAAGEIVAVAGLSYTRAGDGLGQEETRREDMLSPIETCKVTALPNGEGKIPDDFVLMEALRRLEEEEPMLHVLKDERTGDITVQIMGQVQIEILKSLMQERFGIGVEFGEGTIVYKETIRMPVEGVGHFEPLRHYAEVHLVLEPQEPGSGITFENHCLPEMMDKNWQNLVMTHLGEKTFRGVLTGSELTDVKISLIGGRAHVKHTEGGDFRRATYRAVRQALMSAQNVLLEPILSFTLELPQANLGRALTDFAQMGGKVSAPDFAEDGSAILKGTVPAASLGSYAQEVVSYTAGRGHLEISLAGYEPCHNAREVIENIGYDPNADRRNVSYSVFCSHGAGTIVPWDHVREHMQVETGWTVPAEWIRRQEEGSLLTDDYYTFVAEEPEEVLPDLNLQQTDQADHRVGKTKEESLSFEERQQRYTATEKELAQIFEKTYGPVKKNLVHPDNEKYYNGEYEKMQQKEEGPAGGDPKYAAKAAAARKNDAPDEYLLVDGYNIIFAWQELKDLAAFDIKAARDRLMDILSNYAGYSREIVILVFDAYKVTGGLGEIYRYGGIDVVFTKEAETADLYIEKTAHKLRPRNRVTVASSDAVEQVIIYGTGAIRLSARGLLERVLAAQQDLRDRYL